MKKIFLGLSASLALALQAQAEPNWDAHAPINAGGRGNIYELSGTELKSAVREGRIEALNYPVEVTGILVPYEPMKTFLNASSADPLRQLLENVARSLKNFHSFDDMQKWLGLHRYPALEGEGPYFIPFKPGLDPEQRMGLSLIDTPQARGFTISCAECHSAELFGRQIIGLTNRFPRGNAFFAEGIEALHFVNGGLFQWSTQASAGETELFNRTKAAIQFVQAKRPVQLGLDTSLAQVALSLATRAQDEWASQLPNQPRRDEKLARIPADSKPAVWWNVKYKNRWLSDGSVLSGNPIFTNIIWNEIGRGTDLQVLSRWFEDNSLAIRNLTAAVFASEAPAITDFFSAEQLASGGDLVELKQGQKLFSEHCTRCHGQYQKAWDSLQAGTLTLAEKLKTTNVIYHKTTPVYDVGTDAYRYKGMSSLLQLNNLEISKRNNILIEAQKGYVPPPLVGIWARWPYFHNNSAPSLCAVLSHPQERPPTYWARPANDPKTDFDFDCNGYPQKAASDQLPQEYFYDTRKMGLSNAGHDEQNLTLPEKHALIRFLQTL